MFMIYLGKQIAAHRDDPETTSFRTPRDIKGIGIPLISPVRVATSKPDPCASFCYVAPTHPYPR